MKKLLLIITCTITLLSSCQKFNSDYAERKAGVLKVCPKCVYVYSQSMHIAIDTSRRPNSIYEVSFCSGFVYPASDVDHLTKIY